MVRILALCLSLLVFSGCASVTITPEGGQKLRSDADYQERQGFFVWGLLPAAQHIQVDEICPTGVRQMQAQNRAGDNLLRAVTLGFYAPRTVRLWCTES